MFKETLRELPRLIGSLFKKYGLKSELLEVPSSLVKQGNKVEVLAMLSTLMTMFFAYLLKFTNWAIESKMILLGIMFFMAYRSQNVIKESMHVFESAEGKKFETLFDNEIVLQGSELITKVAERVLKFDANTNAYKLMSNEAVMNAIKNYLSKLWLLKIRRKFQLIEIGSAIGMLVFTIATNSVIPQAVFVPLLLAFAGLSFFCSASISVKLKAYYTKNKMYSNEQYVITNDLLRVPPVVKKDLTMRMTKLKQSIKNSGANLRQFHGDVNKSYLVMSIVETLAGYAVIILYLFAIEWQTIELGTIAEITANLIVIETAIGYIRRSARLLESNAEMVSVVEREEEDIRIILQVYDKQNELLNKDKPVDSIIIPPFTIKYIEESENDRAFTLKSQEEITLNKGDVAVLYGVSGSGKSTFMKMSAERIRIEKSTEIPSTSRYLYYDERLRLGSLSIYEELFCMEEPNLEKMQNILMGLHLWQEISCNCVEVWQFLKEKKYENLSNGQKQRVVIAKMLYWLDVNIDVVILDECTSGVDDKSDVVECADAQRILEYIVRYCNRDKKRIVMISTHQSIEECKSNLGQEFNIKSLFFTKRGEFNYVHM